MKYLIFLLLFIGCKSSHKDDLKITIRHTRGACTWVSNDSSNYEIICIANGVRQRCIVQCGVAHCAVTDVTKAEQP